jgi:selenide,water dikinase
MKQLLLAGGGHSHVEVLRRFGRNPVPGVELTLISPESQTAYSGMLPGLVAGHYTWAQCHIDLVRLCRFARARLLNDRVTGLDLYAKRARCESGDQLAFDLISLDIGSTPPIPALPGATEHGIGVKPVEQFLDAWDEIQGQAGERTLRVVVVGGGAGGVELTLAMQHRLRSVGTNSQFAVVSDSDRILPGHAGGVRRRLERVLAQRDVKTHTGRRAITVVPGNLRLEGDMNLAADRVIWATGARAPPFLRESGLQTDDAGFVLIGENLQSISHSNVFASGDVASMVDHPRPKSGVYAVRQGPPLAENLRRALTGRTLEPYFPQPVALALISTGDKYAIASWGPFSWAGAWVWRWKDRIDRRFVAKYRE